MRINSANRSSAAGSSRGVRKPASGADTFSVANSDDEPRLAATSGPKSLTSVDTLLAIQESSDGMSGRKRAVKRASDILDILDEIKLEILSGTLSHMRLGRLLRIVEVQRDQFSDPNLEHVLDEIELRARVELAKFNRIAA